MTDSALGGLQVLDLSQNVSGAYCGKLLACYGAEVWKIEPPSGDPTRHDGASRDADFDADDQTSALFLHLNTGKKSCTLDLDAKAGREILRRLAAKADVLIDDAGAAMHVLQQAGVPAGVVADAEQLATNEHLEARGFYPRLTHPDGGTYPFPGQPIHLSKTPATFRTDAPALGEHNEMLLRDVLGLSEREYQALVEDHIICEKPSP